MFDEPVEHGRYKTLLEIVAEDGELRGRMYRNYVDYMTRKCHPKDVSDKLMSYAQWEAHLGIVPVHMQYVTAD